MLTQRSFQARQYGPHVRSQKGTLAPKWYIVDAAGQTVGRLATILARVVLGKHKPQYTRHADVGDFVVVVNAEKVVFTGNKMKNKLYRDYSGYVSGLKSTTPEEMLKIHPTDLLERAVWGMTNKSTLARAQVKKLKLYAGSEHPHKAQNPQPLPAGVMRRTVLEKK